MSSIAAKDSPEGKAARRLVLAGIRPIGDLVKASLGPRGRDAGLDAGPRSRDGERTTPAATKERLVREGMRLMHQVIQRTREAVGDGTATAAVLAQAIYIDASELVTKGHDAAQLRQGIDEATAAAAAHLLRNARPIAGVADLARVATSSACGDRELGTLVASAIDVAGRRGVFVVDDGETGNTTLAVAGIRLESGLASSRHVDEEERAPATRFTMDDCRILLFDELLTGRHNLLPIFELVSAENAPVLVIAGGFTPATLDDFEAHVASDWLRCAAVKAPGAGDRRRQLLEDVAILTGGQVLSQLAGATRADLGRASRVIIDEQTTTILGAAGDQGVLEARRAELQRAMQRIGSGSERATLGERLAQLSDGLTVIQLKQLHPASGEHRRTRAESAICAARAALDEGYVAGGGVALLRAQAALDEVHARGDAAIGVEIVRRALEEPLRHISANAGADSGSVVRETQRGHGAFGYDAATGRFCDVIEVGVVDAAAVIRAALLNAAAEVGALLTSPLVPLAREQAGPSSARPALIAFMPRGATPPESDVEPPPTVRSPNNACAVLSPRELVRVVRYASIGHGETVESGAPLVLYIDLRRPADSGERAPGSGETFTVLPVQVRVTSPQLEFAPGCDQGLLVLQSDRDATPCTVVGTVAEGVTEVEVVASFYLNDRCYGEVRRKLAVSGRTASVDEAGPITEGRRGQPEAVPMKIELFSQAPASSRDVQPASTRR